MTRSSNGKQEKQLRIITLDARNLIAVTGLLFNGENSFSLHWSEDGILEREVVARVSAQRGNALFYQIAKAEKASLDELDLNPTVKVFEGCEVSKYLFYVDFSAYNSVFQNSRAGGFEGNALGESGRESAIRHLVESGFDVREDNGWTWHYRVFDKSQSMAKAYSVAFIADTLTKETPADGTPADGTPADGTPADDTPRDVFTRNAESAPNGLDSRLCLGIDFAGSQSEGVSWSKYFAYRGLYMTSGNRIELPESVLDESTVLVLDAPRGNVDDDQSLRILKAVKYGADGKVEYMTFPDEFDNLPADANANLDDLLAGVRNPKLFDGEGIISPALAAMINKSLREQTKSASGEATSFQIRMPFTKGVVHEVDFHRFLKEECGINNGRIKDAFNQERLIQNIQMIITTDMLKCHEWLKQLAPRAANGDPMKYYFEKFREYDHALYVSETSDWRKNNGKTEVNWQFLSTLDLTPEEFDEYVRRNIGYLAGLRSPENSDEARTFLCDDSDDVLYEAILAGEPDGADGSAETQDADGSEADVEDDGSMQDEWAEDGGADQYDFSQDDFPDQEESASEGEQVAWRYALEKSPLFMDDPYIRKLLESKVNSNLVKCSRGCFSVPGYLLYLSHDLMRLLAHIGANCQPSGGQDEGRARWKGDQVFMSSDEFYAPAMMDNGANPEGYYGILRSPHLSRSEQAALRLLGDGKREFYERYLGHLKGVVMVACDSEIPMVLGGADFDGDIVRVFSDETIVNAILAGAYEKQGDSYRRRYPIADLSGMWVLTNKQEGGLAAIGERAEKRESDLAAIGEQITYDQLKSTFSGRIGLISNSAMRKGREAYGTMPVASNAGGDSSAERADGVADPCAKYSIATGMEIDAAKTGVRPDIDDITIYPSRRDDFERLGFLRYKMRGEPELRRRSMQLFSKNLQVKKASARKEIRGKGSGGKFITIFKTADYSQLKERDGALKGRHVSNIDRLPWLFLSALAEWREPEGKSPKGGSPQDPPSQRKLFSFEKGDELQLDEGKLKEIEKALRAYQRIVEEKKRFDEDRNWAKRRSPYRKLCRIVSEIPQKKFGDRRDADAIIRQIRHKVQLVFEEQSKDAQSKDVQSKDVQSKKNAQLEACLNRLKEAVEDISGQKYDNWAFWPYKRRCKHAEKYVPNAMGYEPKELREAYNAMFLKADYRQGYMAFYYLLKAVQDELTLKRSMVSTVGKDDCCDVAEDNGEAYGVVAVNGEADINVELYEKFIEISNQALMEGWAEKTWRRVIAQKLRECLVDALGDDSGDLVKYLVQLRRSGKHFSDENGWAEMELFWLLLSVEDIDPYIIADGEAS